MPIPKYSILDLSFLALRCYIWKEIPRFGWRSEGLNERSSFCFHIYVFYDNAATFYIKIAAQGKVLTAVSDNIKQCSGLLTMYSMPAEAISKRNGNAN